MDLRILIVEDDENDTWLLLRYLKNSKLDFTYQTADSAESFEKAIEENTFDIILSDFNIPGFGGDRALNLLNEKGMSIPFVLVSGTIGEEAAVAMMKAGAGDYVMKDNLSRLAEVIKREVAEYKTRNEKIKYQQKSEKLSNIVEASQEIVCTFTDDEKINYLNNSALNFFGFHEIENHSFQISDLLSPESYQYFITNICPQVKSNGYWGGELNLLKNKKVEIPFILSIVKHQQNIIGEYSIIARNIQELKDNELAIKNSEAEKSKLLEELQNRYERMMEFNYIVSHNMRSPIAHVMGLKNLLSIPDMSQEEKEKIITMINDEIKLLDDIIIDLNDILSQKSAINEKIEAVNLPEIYETVKGTLKEEIKKSNAEIQFQIASELHDIKSIEPYIKNIFYTLLSNAIKFRNTENQLKININITKKDDLMVMTFEDNGIGLDMEAHGMYLFGLYKRFHLESEGKGLGLFMAKTQIDSMRGNIICISNLGQGSKFIVSLPLNE